MQDCRCYSVPLKSVCVFAERLEQALELSQARLCEARRHSTNSPACPGCFVVLLHELLVSVEERLVSGKVGPTYVMEGFSAESPQSQKASNLVTSAHGIYKAHKFDM